MKATLFTLLALGLLAASEPAPAPAAAPQAQASGVQCRSQQTPPPPPDGGAVPADGEIRPTPAVANQAYAFDLSGANLFGSTLYPPGADVDPQSSLSLAGWSLSRADLSELVGLAEANLSGANLTGANLSSTDPQKATP